MEGLIEKRVEEGITGLLVVIKDDLSAKLSEITILERWNLRVGTCKHGRVS